MVHCWDAVWENFHKTERAVPEMNCLTLLQDGMLSICQAENATRGS